MEYITLLISILIVLSYLYCVYKYINLIKNSKHEIVEKYHNTLAFITIILTFIIFIVSLIGIGGTEVKNITSIPLILSVLLIILVFKYEHKHLNWLRQNKKYYHCHVALSFVSLLFFNMTILFVTAQVYSTFNL